MFGASEHFEGFVLRLNRSEVDHDGSNNQPMRYYAQDPLETLMIEPSPTTPCRSSTLAS